MFAALGRLVSGEKREDTSVPSVEVHSASEILNHNELWERVEGDLDLFESLRELFLRDFSGIQQQIRDAIGQENFDSLMKTAHQLKGMAANLSAISVRDVASRLEGMGSDSSLFGASEAYEELEMELSRFTQVLIDFEPPQ